MASDNSESEKFREHFSKVPRPSLTTEVWKTKAWRLGPVIFVYIFSVAVLLPAKPDVLTNFFASERAGSPIVCGKDAQGVESEFCRNAHSDAVWWGSLSDFASHSLVTFLLAPLVGHWSDRHGRKPFLSIFLTVACVPTALLAAHINLGLSLYYYFPAQAFAGSNAFLSLCTAFVSDLVSPNFRAAAIGLIMAAFSVAFLIGPAIGGFAGTVVASEVSVFGSLLALGILLVFVPESLGNQAKEDARSEQKRQGRWAEAPWNCMKILGRTELFLKLTACVIIIGFVSLGLLEMLAQYLQIKLDYDQVDLAIVMTIAGACGLLAQTVVLRLLMKRLGETRILVLGSAARVFEQVAFCVAQGRAAVDTAVVLGALAALTMPAISSLVSKNAQVHEQGKAQGALYGVFALSQGFGPLAFAYLFSGFTRSDSAWGYFPGAPFLFGAALMVGCTFIALTIDRRADLGVLEPGSLGGSAGGGSGSVEVVVPVHPATDLAAAGGLSLVQRAASAATELSAKSSSQEGAPPQKRGSLEQKRGALPSGNGRPPLWK